MKNTKYYFSLLLVHALITFGCTDLEDKAEDAIATNSPIEAGALDPATTLQGTYSRLNSLTDQANVYALMEHPSDEMMGPTRGTDWSDFGTWRQLHQHTWDASHNQIFAAWDQLNTGALRATQTILLSGNNTIKAEASFLRAFFTFYVVDLFGKVPVRLELNNPNEIPKVLTRSEAVEYMIDDLEFAVANLPSVGASSHGKATKEAAQFLLAKIYLNKPVYTAADPAGPYTFTAADMQKVIEYCDLVISSGQFELTDYWTNFMWENSTESNEIIFGIENTSGSPVGNVRNRYYMTTHYNQQPSGWNGFTTVAEFYDKWNDGGDIRKGAAIPGVTNVIGIRAGFLEGQQFKGDGTPLTDRGGNPLIFTEDVDLLYSNERQGVRVIKYIPQPGNLDNPGTDYIFFRFADVLLMKAEGQFRSGNTSGALALINELRTERGASPLSAVTEQAILDERGFELYWEGWRRNDQIRFGTFLNAWQEKPETASTAVLFPIPQRAVDTNPNLQQNNGY